MRRGHDCAGPAGRCWPGNLEDRLDAQVHAGSIFKLVVARAALTQGLVTPATRVVCPRRLEVQGRRVDCVHPDLGRPLTLDDALAYSCNSFFAGLAERLDRAGLASTLRRLSAGAIPLTDDGAMPLVVLGLAGPRAGLRTWTQAALAALQAEAGDGGEGNRVRLGAERAVSEGTASALADPMTLTLAKTGTTIVDGVQEGYAVAWRPEVGEAIVVRAPGVAGRDAARIARLVWDGASEAAEPRVRVGRVRDAPEASSLPRVDEVPLEAYVAGVVASEGEASMPAVALSALAVAARSYAIASSRRHAAEGFDLCDTTHCQVQGRATRWSRDAATRTSGLTLAGPAGIVAVPYSASCSGELSSPRALWGGTTDPVTRTGPDPVPHDVTAWQSSVSVDALAAALAAAGFRGDMLRGVRVVARSSPGVPSRIALDGLAPADVDATTFRHIVGRRIGWDVLKSHAWDVTRTGHGYRFAGQGKGHGAGLCLRGAAVFAARGGTMRPLLATYAPGASVVSIRDDVALRVPAAYTAVAPRLRLAARSTLAELRERLGVGAPRGVVIEVHPTVQAYQRATGRAWWTAASTKRLPPLRSPGASGAVALRYRIDVAPLAGGHERSADRLEGVLRHELVHVLTDAVLSGQAPAWALEGLAHAAARPANSPATTPATRPGGGSGGGPGGGPGGSPGGSGRAPQSACPTEEDIARPGSRAAMITAYESAAACVQAALPSGLDGWRRLVSR